jgi:lysophospholipase L1-like esterase
VKRILLTAALLTSLTGTGTASAATDYPNLAAAFNNVGISAAGLPTGADIDGTGHSLIAEDLVAAGWLPGSTVTLAGAKLRLPDAAPGTPDNVAADGQLIQVRGSGSALTLLVTSTGAATTGSGVITYSDGTTQNYELGAPDWYFGPTDIMALSTPRWNTPAGPSPFSGKLYPVSVPLKSSGRVVSVRLPPIGMVGSAPRLHVFALGFRPASGAWTATWSAAVDDGLAPWPWTNRTLRMVEHTSVGGRFTRIRLDNAFGPSPLTVGHATVAVRKSGETPTATPTTLTFDGRPQVTMPAGGQAISDSVPFSVPADSDLLVSLYLPGTVRNAPMHNIASQDMYSTADGTGDHTADVTSFPTNNLFGFWTILSGIDITGPSPAGSVVTFGDSITDGYLSTPNTNRRWPDFLARRLLARPLPTPGVVNEGISGNRVLSDAFNGLPGTGNSGISAQARLERDLTSQSGVRTAIVLEGINDVNSGSSGDAVIAGLKQLAKTIRAAHIRVIGGTLTPIKGCECDSPAHSAARRQVNDFIRNNGGTFDAWVDFDAAIRDPADPLAMLPAYDSGDHLHPGDAGYEAMAAAIDLSLLS